MANTSALRISLVAYLPGLRISSAEIELPRSTVSNDAGVRRPELINSPVHGHSKDWSLRQHVVLSVISRVRIILVEKLPSNHSRQAFAEVVIQQRFSVYGDSGAGSKSTHIESNRDAELLVQWGVGNSSKERIPPNLRTPYMSGERTLELDIRG